MGKEPAPSLEEIANMNDEATLDTTNPPEKSGDDGRHLQVDTGDTSGGGGAVDPMNH